jgi:glycine cleavage system H protein
VCGTGYTGEDGVELLLDPGHAPAVWADLLDRGALPIGLAARDTLRLEVCYHLYGNDLMEERGPIEAGLGWCCKEATGFIGHEAVAAVRRPAPREARPLHRRRPGHRAPGQPRRGGGVVTSGTMSPSLEVGHRDGLRARRQRAVGTELEIDVRGRTRSAVVASKPLYTTRRRDPWPTRAIPTTCCTTPSTTGPRSTATSATLGITWYAQDALGEVVFFDPPEVGASVTKDESYAEVESVKAVSDVIAPLSGEIVEVNAALSDAPEKINDDPYGEGWLVKVRMSDPSERDSLMEAAKYEATLT